MSKSAQLKIGDKVQSKCKVNFGAKESLAASSGMDPWKEIRLIIDGFNDNRQQGIIPGSHIAVDEPEGEGAEMKALADGQTKILIRLDVMEGKEHQRKKAFADIGSEGTAVTLLSPNHGLGVAELFCCSAFSSVKTCMALRIWPSFMGIIRLLTKYPLTYLTSKAVSMVLVKSNPEEVTFVEVNNGPR
ncbi:hypothetical protein EMCRGX_G027018 [Ephydatia muelleri]